MSEETDGQQKQPEEPAEPKWGDPLDRLDPARKADLQARLWGWKPEDASETEKRSGPFAYEQLNGSEVIWLAACALAGTNADNRALSRAEDRLRSAQTDAVERFFLRIPNLWLQRAYLDGAYLPGAILNGAQLHGAALSGAHLEGATLRDAQLAGAFLQRACLARANFHGAHLVRADLTEAHLEEANFGGAHLEEATLTKAYLEGADLAFAQLQRAGLMKAHLEGADLAFAQLKGASLQWAYLEEATLTEAHLERAFFYQAHLQNALLRKAHLEETDLMKAYLAGANFIGAQLRSATLREAQLQGADLSDAQLSGADLRAAFLDVATNLSNAVFRTCDTDSIRVVDVRWGGVNLATLKGPLMPPLGDEQPARAWKPEPLAVESGKPQPTRAECRDHDREQQAQRIGLYRDAVRANRQFAVELQNQGMSEEAARFAYRAQVLQRTVYRMSGWRSWGRWFFSGLLDGLAGYGYRPERSAGIYLVIIALFTGLYYLLSAAVGPHLSLYEALVVSVTAFHGRGFFATTFQPGDPQAGVAALEAVIGLLIEISFIATFTQRFFGAK